MTNIFNETPIGPGPLPPITTLAGLLDCLIANPEPGQPLVWDGSAWTNSNTVDLPTEDLNSASGNITLDRDNGEIQIVRLTGDVQLAVANWPAAGQLGRLTLFVLNTGAFNITAWPAGTKWPNGTPPTITSGAGKVDIIVLLSYNAGATVFGTVAGANYS